MKRPEMLNRKRGGVSNALLVTVCALLIALLLVDFWFVKKFVVVEVDGSSMENTVFDGDFVYADRETAPERGDVVIIDVTENSAFVSESEQGKLLETGGRVYIIKRLIAMAGDTVKCEAGVVLVRHADSADFVPLDEPYLSGSTAAFGAVTVGEGEIFVLGDHRPVSKDSRSVGCFALADVEGVVTDWSIDHKDLLKQFEIFRSRFHLFGAGRETD